MFKTKQANPLTVDVSKHTILFTLVTNSYFHKNCNKHGYYCIVIVMCHGTTLYETFNYFNTVTFLVNNSVLFSPHNGFTFDKTCVYKLWQQ